MKMGKEEQYKALGGKQEEKKKVLGGKQEKMKPAQGGKEFFPSTIFLRQTYSFLRLPPPLPHALPCRRI